MLNIKEKVKIISAPGKPNWSCRYAEVTQVKNDLLDPIEIRETDIVYTLKAEDDDDIIRLRKKNC